MAGAGRRSTVACGAPTVFGMDVLGLRHLVYRHIVETGGAPNRATLVERLGDAATVDSLLGELHERHMLVLDDRAGRLGEIRMALPFATEETKFRVVTTDGSWWANCAWDSLAVIAALGTDGRIESTWADTGEPLEVEITAGELVQPDGFIGFEIPAASWWDDIVFT
jgi:hypothetical protein